MDSCISPNLTSAIKPDQYLDAFTRSTRMMASVAIAVFVLVLLEDALVNPDLIPALIPIKIATCLCLLAAIATTYTAIYRQIPELLLIGILLIIMTSLIVHARILNEPYLVSFTCVVCTTFSASITPWKISWHITGLLMCITAILFSHWYISPEPFLPLPKIHSAALVLISVSIALARFTANQRNELNQASQQLQLSERQSRVMAERLDKLADTDYLTGIGNMRGFHKCASQQISQSGVAQRPMALVLIDLDHFKLINDRYGHAVGDQVLKQLADTCAKNIPENSRIFRIGGEEFALLLPGLDKISAIKEAEQLRQTIADEVFAPQEHSDAVEQQPNISTTIHLTLSLGVSEQRSEDIGIQPLIDRCDQRLYQAKHQGRNQVVPPPESQPRQSRSSN